ncbi:uncharacterized protein wu:fl23c11 [Kryptolebias marmoratus]|uniref:Uncharacterized LOC108231950 n=1 Tax=Kryptolebias marmoratus TaxID=37003 RepID=A0A3Q3G7N9_KRYMA|nr:uncharacterized protein wu:fl23c11 [Kryptolebias marmoratus]
MRLSFHCSAHFSACVLLRLCLTLTAGGLEVVNKDTPELICSQGLTNCSVSSGAQFSQELREPYGSVNVTQVRLTAVLFLSDDNVYEPCLQINITLKDSCPEGSGEDDEKEGALVKVGLSFPGSTVIWKAIKFNLRYGSTQDVPHELLLTQKLTKAYFGSTVVVIALSKEKEKVQNITLPENVCVPKLNGIEAKCNVPRLHAIIEDGEVRLKQENANSNQGELSYLIVWDGISRKYFTWPKNKSEIVVPSEFIAPCLCFQAWWDGEERVEYCPFRHHKDAFERMKHIMLVTMEEAPSRRDRAELIWKVSSPCRLKGEVQLCMKGLTGSQCEKVVSRQELQDSWAKSNSMHWQTGLFDVPRQPLLCVQGKLDGMKSFSEPYCPFATSRVRWILPLLIGLLVICLAILGAYLIQGVLKGYVWKWLKEDDVKGAVGGSHVVLLYPSDEGNDKRLPGLLCHLGSSLQSLGFTVSLDLWSQAELGALGPVPWLHSRLDRLQRQGGKVVLVLTQATWTRAEEWGARCDRNGLKNRDAEGSYPPSSRHVDVFSASLSCILADYLQGRAGERFMLVQFESLPPQPPGGLRPLPQLFCGLHVYSLPSQSLGFLTELAGTKKMASASARRKRAGGLRMASRALAQKLSGFTAGTNVLRLAGVSQGCVRVGVEDSGETVPLKSYLITPPSSPETDPKVGEMVWI